MITNDILLSGKSAYDKGKDFEDLVIKTASELYVDICGSFSAAGEKYEFISLEWSPCPLEDVWFNQKHHLFKFKLIGLFFRSRGRSIEVIEREFERFINDTPNGILWLPSRSMGVFTSETYYFKIFLEMVKIAIATQFTENALSKQALALKYDKLLDLAKKYKFTKYIDISSRDFTNSELGMEYADCGFRFDVENVVLFQTQLLNIPIQRYIADEKRSLIKSSLKQYNGQFVVNDSNYKISFLHMPTMLPILTGESELVWEGFTDMIKSEPEISKQLIEVLEMYMKGNPEDVKRMWTANPWIPEEIKLLLELK